MNTVIDVEGRQKNGLVSLVISGLGGTGKSERIKNEVEGFVETGQLAQDEFLILCFDRKTRLKFIKKSAHFNERNVLTIHSLAFRVLGLYDKLPRKFMKESYSETDLECDVEGLNKVLADDDKITDTDFDELIQIFLTLSSDCIRLTRPAVNPEFLKHLPKMGGLKLIAMDETQDFREDYVSLIKRVVDTNNKPALIIAGDSHQQIYGFQDNNSKYKLADLLNNYAELFPAYSFKIEILTENYRCENPALISFMNSFLAKKMGAGAEVLYSTEARIKTKWVQKPVIKYFTHKRDELEFVRGEIDKIDTQKHTIAIIGRASRDIRAYLKLYGNKQNMAVEALEEGKKVTVETIHALKGDEADFVFYVGFSRDDRNDRGIDTIIYTAISRAKKKLYITSSHPVPDLTELFREETFQLVNVQRKLVTPFTIRKYVDLDSNFTFNKLSKNTIDSLIFMLRGEDVPFYRYVKKLGTKQKENSNCERILTDWGEFSVEKHNGWQNYIFNFKDLNLLKKNGFCDRGIVEHCLNEVYKYFDFRVEEEQVIVHGLHLCQFLQFSSYKDRKAFIDDVVKPEFLKSTHHSIIGGRHPIRYENIRDFNYFVVERDTLYNNHHESKNYGLTTVIYDPKNKENDNKIHIPNLLKIELRAAGSFLYINKAKKLPYTASNLLDNCSSGLKDMYWKWLKAYYGADSGLLDLKKWGVSSSLTK